MHTYTHVYMCVCVHVHLAVVRQEKFIAYVVAMSGTLAVIALEARLVLFAPHLAEASATA